MMASQLPMLQYPEEGFMVIRLSLAAVSVVLALSFGVMRFGFGVAEATQQSPAGQGTTQPQQSNMQDMMKMHDQMMAEMKAGDAKLDALVKNMNTASGDAKVTAVAAVVSELVRQHQAMHDRMGQMHQHMMGGRGMMMRR
jgi:hypothetical protein